MTNRDLWWVSRARGELHFEYIPAGDLGVGDVILLPHFAGEVITLRRLSPSPMSSYFATMIVLARSAPISTYAVGRHVDQTFYPYDSISRLVPPLFSSVSIKESMYE
jgi:hypothetical protein